MKNGSNSKPLLDELNRLPPDTRRKVVDAGSATSYALENPDASASEYFAKRGFDFSKPKIPKEMPFIDFADMRALWSVKPESEQIISKLKLWYEAEFIKKAEHSFRIDNHIPEIIQKTFEFYLDESKFNKFSQKDFVKQREMVLDGHASKEFVEKYRGSISWSRPHNRYRSISIYLMLSRMYFKKLTEKDPLIFPSYLNPLINAFSLVLRDVTGLSRSDKQIQDIVRTTFRVK